MLNEEKTIRELNRLIEELTSSIVNGVEIEKELIENVKVYSVPGEWVRVVDPEMTMGGHHYIYPFIPEDEIWIDKTMTSPLDIAETIAHELAERILMKRLGLSYEDAHDIASYLDEVVYKKIKLGK